MEMKRLRHNHPAQAIAALLLDQQKKSWNLVCIRFLSVYQFIHGVVLI